MKYPDFPSHGDLIGICAPSAGVGGKLESFDLSLDTLRSNGYDIRESISVRNDSYPSAPAAVRGAEFNAMFGDSDISMVISASGGDYCIEMLPYIDQDLVTANPKWFAGYSDPTSIEMLLTTKLDIATIYGVNAGAWDWRPLHEFQHNALSVLKGELPEQHSYDMYSSAGFDDETFSYEMDAPVEWLLFGAPELDVTGRLIGGCIDVIDWITGTPYEDLEGFCARYAEDGFIWFFDNFELNPLQLQYALRKLQLKGLFDNARAVIFGRTFLPGDATDSDYLGSIGRVLNDIGVPVVWNADIGHTKPSFTLINGAMAHFVFEHGTASLSMQLR